MNFLVRFRLLSILMFSLIQLREEITFLATSPCSRKLTFSSKLLVQETIESSHLPDEYSPSFRLSDTLQTKYCRSHFGAFMDDQQFMTKSFGHYFLPVETLVMAEERL
jgi:hypothetical protein